MKSDNRIAMAHGNGGLRMHDLIDGIFMKYFRNPILEQQSDSAIIMPEAEAIAFTTDSFVIDPVFFPGGNIGKLAVCGTVNDLAVSGAIPVCLSASFILEEGLLIDDLERIVAAMADEARQAGVPIVTGDTKVVNKGKCDRIFINTAGIGRMEPRHRNIGQAKGMKAGDLILINGTIGDHGMAVMSAREAFSFRSNLVSDCASLNHLIRAVLDRGLEIRFMRDPTRGGVAAVLNELAQKTELGIELDESSLPLNGSVTAMCELLGFDPLHIANEGKVIMVVDNSHAEEVLSVMRNHPLGVHSAVIGEVRNENPGKLVLKTVAGGRRIVDILAGDPLPRIC